VPTALEEEFENLRQEFVKGEYVSAINQIDNILNTADVTTEERQELKILKSRCLGWLGYFAVDFGIQRSALTILDEIQEEMDIKKDKIQSFNLLSLKAEILALLSSWEEFLDIMILVEELYHSICKNTNIDLRDKKARYYFLKVVADFAAFQISRNEAKDSFWEPNKSIELADQSFRMYEEIGYEFESGFISCFIANIYTLINEIDKVQEYYKNGIKIFENLKNKTAVCYFYIQLADVFWLTGDFDLRFKNLNIALNIAEEINYEEGIAYCYNDLGVFYHNKGDRKKAKEYYEKSLVIYQSLDNSYMTAVCTQNIGSYYRDHGQLDIALEHYIKARELVKKDRLEEKGVFLSPLSNIGLVYLMQGKLKEAQEIMKELIPIYEKKHWKEAVARTLRHISLTHLFFGDAGKAIETSEKSLQIREEIGNKLRIAESLVTSILIATEFNFMTLSSERLEQLKKIKEELKEPYIETRYPFSEALILKKSSETRDRLKAEVLFEQLLEKEIEYYLELYILSSLCELYIYELNQNDDIKLLKKLEKYAQMLKEKAEEQGFSQFHVDSLFFLSQISLLKLQMEDARSYLSEALQLAKERELDVEVDKLIVEKEKLKQKITKLEKLDQPAISMSKRIELVEINETMEKMKKNALAETQVETTGVTTKLFSLKI
jgi:tetratricopeptide (TPR) repeat protein